MWEEIEQHFRDNADRFVNRLEGWLRLSDAWHTICPGSQTTPETLKAFAEQGWYCAELSLRAMVVAVWEAYLEEYV
ncbi:hypothetical protein MRX96_046093 [Rhipicephalus microplus]